MSEINALDNLREWARIATTADDPIWEIIGEIESEIQERYLLLPVDADGVPIHVGDEVELTTRAAKFHACLKLSEYGWLIDNDEPSGFTPDCVRHVKPRTLEDVLCDMIHEYGCTDARTETIADKYAAEIREFMAGDAE